MIGNLVFGFSTVSTFLRNELTKRIAKEIYLWAVVFGLFSSPYELIFFLVK